MQMLLQTCTADLAKSINYFRNLDYTIQKEEDFTIAYDSQMQICIGHDRKTRPGVTLIKKDWTNALAAVKKITKVISKDEVHYFADPSGCWYKLITGNEIEIPKTKTKCLLGNYAGISLETMDIEQSMAIVACLGFEQSGGGIDKGWVSFTDKANNTISLMAPFACPHLFYNPSATFFNGKENPQIIASIRSRNIAITEELTVFNPAGEVDNIILREPGGYGFFIFND